MKFYVLTKKTVLLTVAIILLLITGILVFALAPRGSVPAAAQARRIPVYCVEKQEKVVSLTFDAAWGDEDTETLIDILGEHQIRATFFVTGGWAAEYPEDVKKLHDAGHEIGSHSDTHPDMSVMDAAGIKKEIDACASKVEAAIGEKPTLFRPPSGAYSNTLIDTMDSLGYDTIQWSVDSLDWKGISADEISERVLSKVEPGSIILFHNAAEHTPEALPGIIAALTEQGYSFVPVSELLLEGEYTIDNTGKMCAKKTAADNGEAKADGEKEPSESEDNAAAPTGAQPQEDMAEPAEKEELTPSADQVQEEPEEPSAGTDSPPAEKQTERQGEDASS